MIESVAVVEPQPLFLRCDKRSRADWSKRASFLAFENSSCFKELFHHSIHYNSQYAVAPKLLEGSSIKRP